MVFSIVRFPGGAKTVLSGDPLYLEILPPCTFIKPSTFIRNTRVVVGAISIAFASPPSKTIESGFEELNASVSEVFVNRTHSLQLDNF